MPVKDLSGKKFGRWKVIGLRGMVESSGKRYPVWRCVCLCGTKKNLYGSSLKYGTSKSCGCYNRDQLVKRATHGHARKGNPSRTYISWFQMKSRCLSKKCKAYKNYGGRGITICKRWLTFSNFLDDMGECPPGLTLERVNNKTGNYEPKNCVWDTRRVQSRNKRNNVVLAFNGKTQIATDWANQIGIDPNTLFARVRLGWDARRALTEPVRMMN